MGSPLPSQTRLPLRARSRGYVRAWTAVATIALGLWIPVAAYASAPTPSPTAATPGDNNVGPATPGTKVCTVTNAALDEITGIVATEAGIFAVEGGDTVVPSGVVVWTINASTCDASSRNHGFSPVDPQDLAVGSDGALWVADIGDGIGNDNERSRLTFEKVQPGGSAQAVPHRALYPQSGTFTAEAMLLQRNDVPLVLVNESGKIGLYSTGTPPPTNTTDGLPTMARVGEFVPAKTGTKNPMGNIGNALVTGAARSPNGRKVVVRTVSDAYEWTVAEDGDVVKAITQGIPSITRLPDEENGQAITYSADGTLLLTLSSVDRPVLRSYTPYVPPAAAPGDAGDAAAAAAPTDGRGWFQRLSFSDLTLIATLFGLAGMVTMIAGVVGVVMARRRRRAEAGEDDEYGDHGAARPARPRPSGRRGDAAMGRRTGGHTRPHDDRGDAVGRPARASGATGRADVAGGSRGGGSRPGAAVPAAGGTAGTGSGAGGSWGARGQADPGRGRGGGSGSGTYRGSAKVMKPPPADHGPPPNASPHDAMPHEPRRPSGGQVYGSSSRYPTDDDVT